MFLAKKHLPILIVNLVALLGFGGYYLSKQNYEFILYISIIVAVLLLVLFTNKKVGFSNLVLWGLTIWGILHMAGGSVIIGDHVLYKQILWLFSSQYEILKFDQFVHFFGFGVATMVMYELIKPLLGDRSGWVRVSIVIIMAGLGVGALNEIIEFIATVITPETGVGGYINTSLDLVSNLLGAMVAMVLIYSLESKQNKSMSKTEANQ